MYTPEFHSYHTVVLLSDLDFFTLVNEHIFMKWHQTRVSSRRYGSIIISPAQYIISYELGIGLVYNLLYKLNFANKGRNRVGCGLFCKSLNSRKRDAN